MPAADRTTRADAASPGFSLLLPTVGFLLLGGMSWLYARGSALYSQILGYWTFIPWRYPFIDLAAVPAWVHCWQQHGFDVYTDASWASCGVGPIIYSPLLLRLTILPTDPSWTNWLGLTLVAAYLLSLGLLPHSRRLGDRLVMVGAAFSCLPVFAMERANLDLLVFLLALVGTLCLGGRLACPVLGYALMLTGGLMKFYPFVLLLITLRERLWIVLALGAAAAAIMGGTAFVLMDELQRLTPVPSGAPFHNMWGARNLPSGLPTVLRAFLDITGMPDAVPFERGRLLAGITASALLGGAMLLAFALGRRSDLAYALDTLPDRTWRLLVTGSVLIVGCFFAGQNIGYRGVFLLLVMPGLLDLAHGAGSRRLRMVFGTTAAALLLVLWELTERRIVADLFGGGFHPVDTPPGYTIWLIQELAWWWIVAVLLAVLMRFVAVSPVWQDLNMLVQHARHSPAG